jgi:EAL domain-containing protein (putative c-di-GMP-specific phosphodiesterase class I)
MLKDSEDLAVVSSIVTLCKEFRRNVIAEGVENISEAKKLKEFGCLHLQGYGISMPMPADQVMSWIKTNTPYKFKSGKTNTYYVQ